MKEDEAAPAGGAEEIPQGSVFGNLPDSRPGVRSPRRDRARRRGRSEAGDVSDRDPGAAATAQRARPSAAPPEPEADRHPEPSPAQRGPGGLEDVAWAGVAAAAEAATIGVRIANRAFEALRDAVDRR